MRNIKLIKSSFYNEQDTKNKLCDFIQNAKILSMHEECRKFEENFSKFQNRKYSLFVSSGSMANLLLIQALLNSDKLKKGDKIGLSTLTWATNVMPIIQLGLKPILIDCEIETLNVSSKTLKEILIKNKINALFLTNALGFCSDIDKITKICNENNILFIEDNCESLGSEYKNKKLGNFGLASTFSFFVGHHLSTIEGGMICTDEKELYNDLLMIRAHGWSRNLADNKKEELKKEHNVDDFYDHYTFYDLSYNARPTEINGFIGNFQIQYIDEIIKKREMNFKKINEIINANSDLVNLDIGELTTISNFGIPFVFKNEKLFNNYKNIFEKNGVEIRPIISGNTINQPFFKKYCSTAEQNICKNADFVHKNGFYCGNNPEMTEEEIDFICDLIKI
ncbi:MAG: aminotransferase class V-fold PLP-dependent enzyme [Candidatus Aenigmarchaeota archaeon]|nr:aminotransferase class V-fold PLP-dependent enzyme [Candidatus Aenigmarchaeota archaeon]